jgi:hypothetical protein
MNNHHRAIIRASIAAVAASCCLLAADTAPGGALSPEFAKAGLKALVTLQNSRHPGDDGKGTDGLIALRLLLHSGRIQTTFDDAEVAANTQTEKYALFILQTIREMNLSFRYELTKACRDELDKELRSGKPAALPECERFTK